MEAGISIPSHKNSGKNLQVCISNYKKDRKIIIPNSLF